jgi:hypothetical protein
LSNVVALPIDDFEEADHLETKESRNQDVMNFATDQITTFCHDHGVDVTTETYNHQLSVIVTQLQLMLMGVK